MLEAELELPTSQQRAPHLSSAEVQPFELRLYNPDDPRTYPPSFSAIFGNSGQAAIPEIREVISH
ncbi:hypothetical protein C8Q70DRAFT_1050630 [Cubamyces menziesii]|nr:hypothetical protein C8Q70DRAFT_1050630 [Cubamyces menziesii]